MRTFISFLGALLVAFLLFPGTNGGLTLTDQIIEQICRDTRDIDRCKSIMRINGFNEGIVLEKPYESIVLAFINRAEQVTNKATEKGSIIKYEARFEPVLFQKYGTCVTALEQIKQKVVEARERVEAGLSQFVQESIKSALDAAFELDSVNLSPEDKMCKPIKSTRDVLSMVLSVAGHMSHLDDD